MIGPEMLQEMEQMVKKVQQNLKVAQDQQKKYADQKRCIRNLMLENMYTLKSKKKGSH
jgi:hypothetical protein